MAEETKVATEKENYENIAETIRELTGEDETYTPSEMPDGIRAVYNAGGGGGGGATPEQAAQIEQNTEDIKDLTEAVEQNRSSISGIHAFYITPMNESINSLDIRVTSLENSGGGGGGSSSVDGIRIITKYITIQADWWEMRVSNPSNTLTGVDYIVDIRDYVPIHLTQDISGYPCIINIPNYCTYDEWYEYRKFTFYMGYEPFDASDSGNGYFMNPLLGCVCKGSEVAPPTHAIPLVLSFLVPASAQDLE